MDYLPPDRNLFRRLDTLGEAFRAAVRTRWKRDAAKEAARAWDLEPGTAESLMKGHASARTLAKAVRAEGEGAWALWDAVGELFIGESRAAFEERRLQQIIAAGEDAQRRLQHYRDRQGQLETRAARLHEGAGR